jgi:DNA segregation ATPase FtsK/SpoIIIE, S-DNA-T family
VSDKDDEQDDESDAQIVLLHERRRQDLPIEQPPDESPPAVVPDDDLRDTSFEVVLDDDSAPAPVAPVVDKTPVLQPIIPEHLASIDGLKSTLVRKVARTWHRTRYHVIRSPKYFLLCVIWGLIGLGKAIWVQIKWWWHAEATPLKRSAIDKGDETVYLGLHRESKKTRYTRGRWLLVELISLIGGGLAMWFFAPVWLWIIVASCFLLLLARFGQPENKPIITAAVVQPRFRVITADAVLRAYYAAGLGNPEKEDQKIFFEGLMSRDARDTGSQVRVVLPYGQTHSTAVAALEKIASGLDVTQTQIYLTRDKNSNRRHMLWIADVDPLSIPAGRTPLLDCKPRDVWAGVPFGLNEQGLRVILPLVFQSLLIAAQPRKGKSFSARLIALFAALDPYVRLSVFDGKGSPDWRMFALVAHTYGFGLLPDRVQGDPIQNLLATLRGAKKDILERNQRLSEMDTSVCPEGKLTRDISRTKRFKIPVWVIVLDEFQEYLKTGDEAVDMEIADLLVFCVRVGPSVGVILVSSTQRPVGLGSSTKVGKLFADYRDNHLMRFALKTGSSKVSDYILGDGAHSEGFDSSKLPVGDEYRGIGILYDSPIDNCTVRTFLADGQDTERILKAARRHREKAGTLDGMAAGEELPAQPRDPLADTLDVFGPSEDWASWRDLATRLAEQLPDQYAKETGSSLGAMLRGLKLGIADVSGRVEPTEDIPSGVTTGPKRAALARALARRDREETSS